MDISHLPPGYRKRALAALRNPKGEMWERLHHDKSLISVKLGYRYRLMFRDRGNDEWEFIELIHHNGYNNKYLR